MYAVVACAGCREPWLVELRHARVTCPACRQQAPLARRRRLWEGSDAREGQAAAASLREALAEAGNGRVAAGGYVLPPAPLVRHDDPIDAAAAKGRAVRNQSERAELVAVWLTRLVGEAPHATLLDALRRAGLDGERAETEVVRMLGCDVIFEPRAGWYKTLDA